MQSEIFSPHLPSRRPVEIHFGDDESSGSFLRREDGTALRFQQGEVDEVLGEVVDVGVGSREARETAEEVDGVGFEEPVVELFQDHLLHAKDFPAGVGVGRNVLQLVDGRCVDLFELGGDEERGQPDQLQLRLGHDRNLRECYDQVLEKVV